MSPPTPVASSAASSKVMRANRRRDTGPELLLRSALHRRGHRYRVDYPIRVEPRAVRPDIVFTRARLAVFVDGCFWHGCPQHGSSPRANADYWLPKLAANRARDERHRAALQAAGWQVLRIWEHESVEAAVAAVEAALSAQDSPEPVGSRNG